MGRFVIGNKDKLNIAKTTQVYMDKVQVISEPVERIVEVVKEVEKRVEVPVIQYVDRIIEKPTEIIKEVEKLVEIRVPHLIRHIPFYARWAILVAVLEAIALALVLSGK